MGDGLTEVGASAVGGELNHGVPFLKEHMGAEVCSINAHAVTRAVDHIVYQALMTICGKGTPNHVE